MTIRFYIVPLEIVVHSPDPYSATRTHKYFGSINDDNDLLRVPIVPNVNYQSTHMGLENVSLVRADVTPAQHAILISYPDVIAFPENLNNNATQNAIDDVSPKLEAYKIPSDWIDTSLTYRQILRRIHRIFKVARFMHEHGFNINLFGAGRLLSTTYSELSLSIRNRLTQVAALVGADTSGLTGSSTVRQILKVLMDAQEGNPGLGET